MTCWTFGAKTKTKTKSRPLFTPNSLVSLSQVMSVFVSEFYESAADPGLKRDRLGTPFMSPLPRNM